MSTLTLTIIQQNISLLKKWSGLNQATIIFDSDRDGSEHVTVANTVKNKPHLYFIHFDEKGSVFGFYLSEKVYDITGKDTMDDNHFIFKFIVEHVTDPKMYKKNSRVGVYFYNDIKKALQNRIYAVDGNGLKVCGIGEFGTKFEGLSGYEGLSGVYDFIHIESDVVFKLNRIVIVQME
ncbi:TLDc domain-containing protein [Entamoeba marina]